MLRPFDTRTLDTIVSGARLLASATGTDPSAMERIIRKAAHVACENVQQHARSAIANDRE